MLRPRLSLRRVLLAFLLITVLLYVCMNVLEVTILASNTEKQQNELGPSAPSGVVEVNNLAKLAGWVPVQGNLQPEGQNESPESPTIPDGNQDMDGGGNSWVSVDRPWFVQGGGRRPERALRDLQTGRRAAKLFPEESPTDRIVDQLQYVPADYRKDGEIPKIKKILLPNGLGAWNVRPGSDVFRRASNCPVNSCELTADHDAASEAAAIIYKDHFIQPNVARPKNQIWMLYFLECPYHTPNAKSPEVFNWTATYRRDSDLVAPYEKWYYYNSQVTQFESADRNYALNKTKKVAWFVSNCGARNHRLQYANELKRHIQVDIYGACGSMRCPRYNADKCFDILDKDYKFYLAFENSNCQDYITEKFFVNGLGRNILPIVMGARPEDYEVAAPYNSYIHVDEFESPRELAEYLHRLDKDDELYNSYFKWKGTGEFINTYFWCRVCAMLHDDPQTKMYKDVNEWWRGSSVCTQGSWRRKGPPVEEQEVEDSADGI